MVPKICSTPECNRRHKARGYCSMHYSAWFRETPKAERREPTREERFWSKVTKSESDGCWHWTATINDAGYGIFHDGTRNVRAHRFSYELSGRELSEDRVVDHTCHNDSGCFDVPCLHRRCVNPNHLDQVTQRVNSIRGRSGDHHLAKTHCPHGHPYSPENTYYGNGGRKRTCKTCHQASTAAYYKRRKTA